MNNKKLDALANETAHLIMDHVSRKRAQDLGTSAGITGLPANEFVIRDIVRAALETATSMTREKD